MHRDDIVVGQRGLRFWRRRGIERASDCLGAQARVVGYLPGDSLWTPDRFRDRMALNCLDGQQFSIAPDMLVPLLFRQIERVKVLGDLNQLGLKRVNGA
jgi:hypothetical protein